MANTKPKTHHPVSEFDLARGVVERNGEHVTLAREGGVYVIRRSFAHPAGHGFRTTKTLREARMLSSTLRNERAKP